MVAGDDNDMYQYLDQSTNKQTRTTDQQECAFKMSLYNDWIYQNFGNFYEVNFLKFEQL